MQRFEAPAKDPTAVLLYGVDWDKWLRGETITDYDVAESAGIVKDSEALSGSIVQFTLSGGTVGETYTVAVTITTSTGRIDKRSVTIPVSER